MKKIGFVILLAVIGMAAWWVRSAKQNHGSSSQHPLTSLAEFTAAYPGDWQVTKDDAGQIRFLTGGFIAQHGTSPEGARSFMERIVPLLGIKSEELWKVPTMLLPTPESMEFRFAHRVNGILVYDSFASVLFRKSDRAIVAVNNQIKNIRSLELARNLDDSRILSAADLNGQQILAMPVQVIAVDPHGVGRLGWQFEFLDPKTRATTFNIRSAKDGSILVRSESDRFHPQPSAGK